MVSTSSLRQEHYRSIDGITLSGLQYYINGWACAKTYAASVDVWIYVGGPAGTGT
jgi:hypothetical protein